MKTRTILLLVVAILLLVILSWSAVYAVDRTEFAYVTQFGRHVATHDGENDAGLHVKWPWPVQSVQRLDHRLQVFDLPETEMLTHDPKAKTIDKTLTIGAYVCWRIAGSDGADQFIRAVGKPDRVPVILGQRIRGRLEAEISKMPLEELISEATPQQIEERMDRLRARLLDPTSVTGLSERVRQGYGIEIVDIRLRRFNHPPTVRDEIFKRIKSERQKKVADYESEGKKLADDIASAAERQSRDILTEAKSREKVLREEAAVKADAIRNQAHSQDPDYYAFLQKLETYKRILGETKDVLLLSSKHELFDMLLKPPKRPEEKAAEPKPKPK